MANICFDTYIYEKCLHICMFGNRASVTHLRICICKICVRVCTCMYVYVCTKYVCDYARAYMYMYVQNMCARMRVHICICMYKICVRVCACMYVCVCTKHVCAYARAYMYMYVQNKCARMRVHVCICIYKTCVRVCACMYVDGRLFVRGIYYVYYVCMPHIYMIDATNKNAPM